MLESQHSVAGAVLALDGQYYTDPSILAKEKERIFYRTWQYACHVSELKKPGDYVTFEILDQGLFTLRDRQGEIRSFYNVCVHRAHELLSGKGNRRLITCPYHAWSYELDGRLRKAPNEERATGFDRAAICLREVRTEIFCGFVFVNLDPAAPSLTTFFPGVEEELRRYVPDIDRLTIVEWVEVPERCNWKVSVENYNECYHCKINHPTFVSGVVDGDQFNIMPEGKVLRHRTGSANLDRMTYPIADQEGEHATDYTSFYLWPSISFQVYPGRVLNSYIWRPLDVENTIVYRGWYDVEGAERGFVKGLAEQDRDTTVAEDVRLVESVQRGLKSRGYVAGPLILDPNFGVLSEHSIKAFQDWVREALG